MAGTQLALTAAGGGSGQPVVFTIDSRSGIGVCTVSGRNLTLSNAGRCVIDANQASDGLNYTAAPTVSQTISVTPAAVVASVSGIQVFGSTAATFFVAPAVGTAFIGPPVCATVDGGTAIGPNLSAGAHTVDGLSCSGLSALNGAPVTYVGVGSGYLVNPAAQSISFTAPVTGIVGQPISLSAAGGGSGQPAVFTVDALSDVGTCSVSVRS